MAPIPATKSSRTPRRWRRGDTAISPGARGRGFDHVHRGRTGRRVRLAAPRARGRLKPEDPAGHRLGIGRVGDRLDGLGHAPAPGQPGGASTSSICAPPKTSASRASGAATPRTRPAATTATRRPRRRAASARRRGGAAPRPSARARADQEAPARQERAQARPNGGLGRRRRRTLGSTAATSSSCSSAGRASASSAADGVVRHRGGQADQGARAPAVTDRSGSRRCGSGLERRLQHCRRRSAGSRRPAGRIAMLSSRSSSASSLRAEVAGGASMGRVSGSCS